MQRVYMQPIKNNDVFKDSNSLLREYVNNKTPECISNLNFHSQIFEFNEVLNFLINLEKETEYRTYPSWIFRSK